MKVNNNRGFSLVELIVVIAIMAILASAAGLAVMRYIDKANVAHDNETSDTLRKMVYNVLLDENNYEFYSITSGASDAKVTFLFVPDGTGAYSISAETVHVDLREGNLINAIKKSIPKVPEPRESGRKSYKVTAVANEMTYMDEGTGTYRTIYVLNEVSAETSGETSPVGGSGSSPAGGSSSSPVTTGAGPSTSPATTAGISPTSSSEASSGANSRNGLDTPSGTGLENDIGYIVGQ